MDIQALMAAVDAHMSQGSAQGDVRDDLYTQILTDDDYHLGTQKYARPFAPGLVQVLIIDTPATTEYVADGRLENFPFDQDEAFRIGQANADAAGYDQINDLGAAGIKQALGGSSVVTAAKLGNMAELCSDAKISAENGVIFLPLHRSNIFFAPISSSADQLDHFRQIAQMGWEAVKDEKGAITKEMYRWTPDGTITRISDGATTRATTATREYSAAKPGAASGSISTTATAAPLPTPGVCAACESPLPDGAKFCGSCGNPVPAEVGHPQPKVTEIWTYCSREGNTLEPGTRFCPDCGALAEIDPKGRPNPLAKAG